MHFFSCVIDLNAVFSLSDLYEFIAEEKELKLHSYSFNLKYDSQHRAFKILNFKSYLYAIYSPPSVSVGIGSRTPLRYQNTWVIKFFK